MKNPCDTILDFGSIRVGKSSCKKISIINEGRLPVNIYLNVLECSTEEIPEISISKCREIDSVEKIFRNKDFSKNDFSSLSAGASRLTHDTDNSYLLDFIDIQPDSSRNLKPKRELEFKITMNATQRLKSFKAQLGLVVDDILYSNFTTVKANCLKMSFKLSRAYVSFGTIFEGFKSEENVILVNDGDVGSKYVVKFKEENSDFIIKPTSGQLEAGNQTVLTCTFKPKQPMNFINNDVKFDLSIIFN